MSISSFQRELAGAAVAGACLAVLADPANPALSSLPSHPIWVIALLLAARHGARGLVSIPVLTGSLVIAEWLSGGTGAAALARTQRAGDLAIWLVAVGVGVVGAAHERRKDLLALRLDAAELRARTAEDAVDKLSDAALALRDRCDRSATSLVFLADVAARINDHDPSGAGQAALELAMARTGAGAGFVQLTDDAGRLRTLTSRGTWSANTFRPPALFRDLTAAAAIERRIAVAAHEVPGVRTDDSDLVAPLITPDGRVIGVIALRRMPYVALAGAVREDLEAVARWAAGPLARAIEGAGLHPAATLRPPGPGMPRRDRQLLAVTLVAAILTAAYWALWIVDASGAALILALVLHVTSAGLTAALIPRRHRGLAIALGLVVPVFGPLAAALSTLIAGRPGGDLLHDPHAVVQRISGSEIARRLTGSLPACEALVSSSAEARRQALAKLKARAAPEDIATLRWARAQPHGDAAVEVALAFEEICARFEQRATAARAAVSASPTHGSSAALFRILTAGITSGLVDAALVSRMAAEACRHHDAAVLHDRSRGRELLAERARLELAMHRPARALALLSGRRLDLQAHRDLAQLYFEAAYAARRFDLVPRSSRATA